MNADNQWQLAGTAAELYQELLRSSRYDYSLRPRSLGQSLRRAKALE